MDGSQLITANEPDDSTANEEESTSGEHSEDRDSNWNTDGDTENSTADEGLGANEDTENIVKYVHVCLRSFNHFFQII